MKKKQNLDLSQWSPTAMMASISISVLWRGKQWHVCESKSAGGKNILDLYNNNIEVEEPSTESPQMP